MCFRIKSCKVDKREFKIEGGEFKIVVKIHLDDKGEFKDDSSKYEKGKKIRKDKNNDLQNTCQVRSLY